MLRNFNSRWASGLLWTSSQQRRSFQKFLRLDCRDLIPEVVDSEVFLEGEALMNIQRVGVVGAGTMGNGIAHVFARSGYRVVLCDVEQRFLDRGVETIGKNLDREVAKNKILAEDKVATLERIEPVVERAKLAGCDFVVEAATEKFDVKAEIFRDLDRLCRPEIILASNTSSISITKLAASDQTAGQGYRNALLQSRARHEAGRSDPRPGYLE